MVLEARDCFCLEDMFKYCCNVYLLYIKIVLLYGQVSLVKEILNLNYKIFILKKDQIMCPCNKLRKLVANVWPVGRMSLEPFY